MMTATMSSLLPFQIKISFSLLICATHFGMAVIFHLYFYSLSLPPVIPSPPLSICLASFRTWLL